MDCFGEPLAAGLGYLSSWDAIESGGQADHLLPSTVTETSPLLAVVREFTTLKSSGTHAIDI